MSTSSAPLPVLTIGGYLGAGKTTLVNHLLRHANGRRLAVLVNEFGDLPIDEDLIEARDDDLISIAGGCICCSFGNDLIGALQDMRAMDPPPDHVIIESSGVAIPGAIVATMSLIEGLQSDGTVVVVDAETLRKSAADDYIGDTITRQLSDAECIIINKTDLIAPEAATELGEWLDVQAPGAIQIPAQHGRVLPDALFGAVSTPGAGQAGAHSDALFDSIALAPQAPLDAAKLAADLAEGAMGVVRAKGFVRHSDGQTWLVQTVGRRWYAQPAQGAHSIGLICLGFRDQLDKGALAALENSAGVS